MAMTHHPFPWTRLGSDLSSLVLRSPLIALVLLYYVLLMKSLTYTLCLFALSLSTVRVACIAYISTETLCFPYFSVWE